MKRRVMCRTLILCMSILLASCGTAGSGNTSESSSESAAPDTQKIGFLVKDSERAYWSDLQEAAAAAAEESGTEIMFLAPGQDVRAETQIQKMDELIEAGADVICVAPSSDEMLRPAMQRAADKGIPVIAVDTDTSFPGKSCFIGTDNRRAAKDGAAYAASQVGSGATAVILRGRLGDKAHDEREEGIREGLEEGGVRVLKALESGPERVAEQTRELLSEYPNLDLIITTEDLITLGVSETMQADGNTKTAVYGFDGLEEAVALVKKGQILGTTRQYPRKMGELCVESGLRLLAGETVEALQDTGYTVITKSNADQY